MSWNEIDTEYKKYEKELFNLIYRHSFDTINIKDIFIEKSKLIKEWNKKTTLKSELEQKCFQYLYNMQYDEKSFVKEFYNLMEINSVDLVSLLSLSTFDWYIELLMKLDLDNKEKYEQFYIKQVKEYIKSIDTNEKLDSFLEEEKIKILDKNEELKSFYEKHKERKEDELIYNLTIEQILEIIRTIHKNNGYGKKDEDILNNIDNNKHRKWILNNQIYYKNILDFVKWKQSFAGNIPFKEFYDKTIEIYKELSKKDKYKIKISFVFKKLNIKEDKK